MFLSLFVYIGIVLIIILQLNIVSTLVSSHRSFQHKRAEHHEAEEILKLIAIEQQIAEISQSEAEIPVIEMEVSPPETDQTGYELPEICQMEAAEPEVVYVQKVEYTPKSLLQDFKCDEITRNMEMLIRNEKKYINPDLRIDEIARDLGVNRTYLSYAINKSYNYNFKTFLNHYRFETMKEMLVSKNSRDYEDIAIKCGFGSLDSLRRIVKNKTGMNLLKYRESLLNDISDNLDISS